MDVEKQIYLPLNYLERRGGFRGDLADIARILVRAAEERPKPNGDRLREYRDSALPSLEQDLFSTAPIYKSLERLTAGGFTGGDEGEDARRTRWWSGC